MVDGLKDQVRAEPRRCFTGKELVVECVNVECLDLETEPWSCALRVEANQVDDCQTLLLVQFASEV